MPKVLITIEEHLCRNVWVDVPQEVIDDKDTSAMFEAAEDLYDSGQIVLTADDHNCTLMAVSDDRFPTEFIEI